ncbi:alpha/beta fold hydrolase [Halorubrum vacuolatum]|nr:alpha/beta hydrolase [Halorubrum vacuolatum]
MPTTTVNDVDLYYERTGDGQPIVFLHGVMMGSRFFLEQRTLPEEYESITLDFRGHGRSAKSETGHTLPTYAADLEAFLDDQELEHVVLVGWSMGALVGWEYVDRFGTDRLDGFVVVDQQPADLQQEGYEHGVFDLAELIDLMELAQTDHHALAHAFIDGMIHGDPEPDHERLMFDEIARVPPAIKSAILFDQSVRDYRDVLDSVDVPTLICVGEDDALVDPAGVVSIADSTPHATIERFSDSSHCPFLEEPDAFTDALLRFADGCQ